MLKLNMRDLPEVEAELMEISAIADDETRLNRIIVWCASHPAEVPMAMHILLGSAGKSSASDPNDDTPTEA